MEQKRSNNFVDQSEVIKEQNKVLSSLTQQLADMQKQLNQQQSQPQQEQNNQNQQQFNKKSFKKEYDPFSIINYNGPIREGNVHLKLPLGKGIFEEEKYKQYYLFRNKDNELLTKYPLYQGKFSLNDHKNIVTEDYFYIGYKKNNKLGFYTSIIENGRKTIGGDLELRNPNNQIDFISVNPINRHDNYGVGYKEGATSRWTTLSKDEVDFYSEQNYELSYLINTVVEREMVDTNSSYFTTQKGKENFSKYINTINDLYKDYDKENKKNKEFYSYDDVEEYVDSFLKTPEISNIVMHLRNEYDKEYAKYRQFELECIVNHEEFIENYAYLKEFDEDEYNKFQELVDFKNKYDLYLSLDKEEIENIIESDKRGYADLLVLDFDYKDIIEMNDIILNQGLKATNNLRDLNIMEDKIGYEMLDDYNKYKDVMWYYKKHPELFPNINDKSLSLEEKNQARYILSQYEEELDHYKIVLKEENFKRAEKALNRYYSKTKIEKLSKNLDELIKETEDIAKKQMEMLNKIDSLDDPVFKEKIIFHEPGADGVVTHMKSDFKDKEAFENKDLKKFYDNARRLGNLKDLIINHPDNKLLDAKLTLSNYNTETYKIEGEGNLPGFIINGNINISDINIERGKKLFGIDLQWNQKKNQENVTVRDKYVFYQHFNDIYGLKKLVHDMEVEYKGVWDLALKEQDEYKKLVDKDERKAMLKKISHSNSYLNLINERLQFLDETIKAQQPDLSNKKMNEHYQKVEKSFADHDKFKHSPQETFEKYKMLGKALRENVDELENARLKHLENPNKENENTVKALERSFVDLVDKHKTLNDYLAVHQKTIYNKYEQLKDSIQSENQDYIDSVNNTLSQTDKERIKLLGVQELIRNTRTVNIITDVEHDFTNIQAYNRNIEKNNNAILKIDKTLERETISEEQYQNRIKTFEIRANQLNDLYQATNDDSILKKLEENNKEFHKYLDNDLDALNIKVMSDMSFGIDNYDQGDVQQIMRNIIESEKERNVEPADKIVEEIIDEYKAKINKAQDIEFLIEEYKENNNNNKSFNLQNFTNEDRKEIGNWSIKAKSENLKSYVIIDEIQEKVLTNIYDKEDVKTILNQNADELGDDFVDELLNKIDQKNNNIEINNILLESKNEFIDKANRLDKGVYSLRTLNIEEESSVNVYQDYDVMDLIKMQSLEQFRDVLNESVELTKEPERGFYKEGIITKDNKAYIKIENDIDGEKEIILDDGNKRYQDSNIVSKTTVTEMSREF